MSTLLCSIILSVSILKSHRILKDSFSVQGKGLCSYHFSGTLKPFFLQVSQWTAFPIQPCRCLYSFWRSLRHSEIMWVTVSSLVLPIRHFGSFLVPSIFVLILLVLTHWSWALAMSDSVSFFKWPFRNQFHDELGMGSFIFPILFSFVWLFFFNYLLELCYFLSPSWSPCCRDENFLTILDIVVKSCYCILCTFLYADKSSVAYFSFDVKPMYIVFGIICLMHCQ